MECNGRLHSLRKQSRRLPSQGAVFAVTRWNGDLATVMKWSPNKSLMSRWKSLTVEQIAVSVALAHVTGLNKRLRPLQQELKAFSFDRAAVLATSGRPRLIRDQALSSISDFTNAEKRGTRRRSVARLVCPRDIVNPLINVLDIMEKGIARL